MTRTSSAEKKSREKWCLRTRLGSWKPFSNGEKRAENGSETVNQVHLQDQGSFTPPFCPQGLALPQYSILFTDTLKGREVWVKIHSLAVKPGRYHIQWVQDTLLDQGSRLLLPLQCMPEVLQGWEALTGAPAMQNKNCTRRWSSSINPFVLFWVISEENRVAELSVLHHPNLSKSPVQWRLQEFYHCHFSGAAALKAERLLTRWLR